MITYEDALRPAVLTFRGIVKVGEQLEAGRRDGVAIDVFDRRGHLKEVREYSGGCQGRYDSETVRRLSISLSWHLGYISKQDHVGISPNNSPKTRRISPLGAGENRSEPHL